MAKVLKGSYQQCGAGNCLSHSHPNPDSVAFSHANPDPRTNSLLPIHPKQHDPHRLCLTL
jgi:hypothetical protein